MKSTDLRIGNLVLCCGKVEKIDKLIGDAIYCGVSDDPANETIEPILLTEDWLLKLGAKKEVLSAGSAIGLYDSYSIGDNELSHVFTNMWGIIGAGCKPMKYVHQLQNLYFSLTREELTYAN